MATKSSLKGLLTAESFLYLLGLLLTTSELLAKIFGNSLCTSEGCRIVETFVRGGEIILVVGGVLLFGVLLFLSISGRFSLIHSTILIAALAVEGYLLGFQSFIIREFCVFCLAVFSIIFIATFLRFLKGKRELSFAFLSLISVFFITYLVNPGFSAFPESRYVLLYSKDCPHCKEVIQYCKELSIPVETIEAKNVAGTLRAMGINSVPVLLCNEDTEKKFILGVDSIKEYLFAKAGSVKETKGVCPIFTPSECK